MNETNKKNHGNDYSMGSDCCGFEGVGNIISSVDDKWCACMSACRWFPLVPVVLGIVAIAAGYFLNPSTIRIIWLAFSIAMMGLGLFALVMMRTMTRKSGKISCC